MRQTSSFNHPFIPWRTERSSDNLRFGSSIRLPGPEHISDLEIEIGRVRPVPGRSLGAPTAPHRVVVSFVHVEVGSFQRGLSSFFQDWLEKVGRVLFRPGFELLGSQRVHLLRSPQILRLQGLHLTVVLNYLQLEPFNFLVALLSEGYLGRFLYFLVDYRRFHLFFTFNF